MDDSTSRMCLIVPTPTSTCKGCSMTFNTIMKKLAALIGVAMLASSAALADYEVVDFYLQNPQSYPNEPGCKLSFSDQAKWKVQPGVYSYGRTSGAVCKIYRYDDYVANGECLASITTTGADNYYFTDFDVVPGETYGYVIEADYEGITVRYRLNLTCQFICRAEFNVDELAFDAEGGLSGQKSLSVSIFKQYKDKSEPFQFSVEYDATFGDTPVVAATFEQSWMKADWDWRSSSNTHTIEFWVEPNENGAAREGMATISISCTGRSYPIRIVQSGKDVSYSSWAEANGLDGTWDAKDENGIYNVFRYMFGVPGGNFTETPLLDIVFKDGKPVIRTPPVVNTTGFILLVEAFDVIDGTGNIVNYVLNANGETLIDEVAKPSRFFRIKVVSTK